MVAALVINSIAKLINIHITQFTNTINVGTPGPVTGILNNIKNPIKIF
jgi:hypothetical protein